MEHNQKIQDILNRAKLAYPVEFPLIAEWIAQACLIGFSDGIRFTQKLDNRN